MCHYVDDEGWLICHTWNHLQRAFSEASICNKNPTKLSHKFLTHDLMASWWGIVYISDEMLDWNGWHVKEIQFNWTSQVGINQDKFGVCKVPVHIRKRQGDCGVLNNSVDEQNKKVKYEWDTDRPIYCRLMTQLSYEWATYGSCCKIVLFQLRIPRVCT